MQTRATRIVGVAVRRAVQRDAEYIMKKRRVDGRGAVRPDVTVFPYLCKPPLHFDEPAARARAGE